MTHQDRVNFIWAVADGMGSEISFTCDFYKYQPSRLVAEIDADIKILEMDKMTMLREVTG